MSSSIDLLYFVPLLFGLAHGLLFATLLVARGVRREQPSDVLLGALVVAGCLLIVPTVLGLVDIHVLWNEWLFLPLDPGLLIGPLLYLFVRAHTNRAFRFGRQMLWHAVPFAVYAIYHLAVFVQGSDFVFRWMDRIDLPYVDPVYKLATLASMVAYLVVSIRHYVAYRGWVESEYASPENVRYEWIKWVLGALAVAILATCLFRLAEAVIFDVDYMQSWWTSAIVTVAIYYVSIAGYVSPSAAGPRFERVTTEQDSVTTSDQPRLARHELDEYKNGLSELMDSRRAYLNPDLSLSDVAEELGTTRGVVSSVINAGHGKNFRRFVNEYRVSAFKQTVTEGRAGNLTLFGLAMDCGFNSKATFNRVFKQIEGVTPNEFVRDQGLRPGTGAS